MNVPERFVKRILKHAGIEVGGKNPWDISVSDDRFYTRLLLGKSLALGESYMDGDWDASAPDQFFAKLIASPAIGKARKSAVSAGLAFLSRIFNRQSKTRAFKVGEKHYDIGNDLYEAMLDKRMTYTCGYWKNAKDLDEAQEAKLDLVCRKLGLKKGDRVLDIGCGWGSFMKFAAERYGVSCVGVTVSKKQIELGQKLCAGLPVEFRLADYRTLDEKFDHIVSLGMFEHVGYKNYRRYFEVARRCLKDGGLFLLHTIGGNLSRVSTDPWIDKYIFPNSMIPSVEQVAAASEGRFVMEDWHNFGADYDKTLMAWFANFQKAWPALKGKYDERFYRMWKYYLLSCAGAFRARYVELWQIVFSKNGVPGGYLSVR